MILDYIVLILCNIFLINILTNIIIKEDLEKENIIKDDDWFLTQTSFLTIIILLIFELLTNFSLFSITLLTLFVNSLIVAALDLMKIKKLKILNKIISEKIIKTGTKILPICALMILLLKFLK